MELDPDDPTHYPLRMATDLYHFSEDPTIEIFTPRPPRAHPDVEPMVWAIDAWHSPLYFVPSECPRVCFWPLPTTTDEDRRRFWTDDRTRMVIAIEHAWLPRLLTVALYRYSLPTETFEDCRDHGVFVSRSAVVPLSVGAIGNPLRAMAEASVELRVTPSLVALGEALIGTSLHWSLIRMRNAAGWEGPRGTPATPGPR